MNEEINITMHIEIPKHNPDYRYFFLTAEKDGKKYEHGRVYRDFEKMPYKAKCYEIAQLCIELLEVIP